MTARYLRICIIILPVVFFGLALSLPVFSQKYTVANAHAHNDYLHPRPFYTAWKAGFGSIEADVFPRKNVLLVAHDTAELLAGNSLKALYLDPLLKKIEKDSNRKVRLLIDIKEDYAMSLKILLEKLAPLQRYLFTYQDTSKPVTILITGERPPPAEYQNYPDYIFFDDDLKLPHTAAQWKRVGLVSLSFKRYAEWDGNTSLSANEKDTLTKVIDQVHRAEKPVRFWAAPDNPTSWTLQMKLGADLIGTDKIKLFRKFLERNKVK